MKRAPTTDPDDDNYLASGSTNDWDGKWVPPPGGKIKFDWLVMVHVNCSIPVLGKTLFGPLKADEWRNLFNIQLPFILPVIWNDKNLRSESILHNFAHLVSLANLALKRSMNADRVAEYCHHIQEYLKISIVIFPDVSLAPNHHMAIQLSECINWFGPYCVWWSFSMEELMAHVLTRSGNNQLGELKITFETKVGCIANLQALLEIHTFPDPFEPYLRQIQSLYDSIDFVPKSKTNQHNSSLDQKDLKRLWIKLKSKKNVPVDSSVQIFWNKNHSEGVLLAMKTNNDNCVIELKPNIFSKCGMIKTIFSHPGQPPSSAGAMTDTWLAVHPLKPVPATHNPLNQLRQYNTIGLSLKRLEDTQVHVVHLKEILDSCAWIK
ncbi:hypothetical protein VP01_3295g4 [Puccinia sorghi]|uniref:DUF4218 domain-containing protein n=1 Tax=Puccinia sorghi TaxID=27349 RepID=A0A0L6UYG1_9BASI|nr:hypothetical protein VP01_3295g4 [Puccinia sorghi]